MSHQQYNAPFGGGGYGGGYGAPGGGYGARPDDGGCRDFKFGRCARGNDCRFAHIKEVCGDFLKGRCSRGELCKFSHDKTNGQRQAQHNNNNNNNTESKAMEELCSFAHCSLLHRCSLAFPQALLAAISSRDCARAAMHADTITTMRRRQDKHAHIAASAIGA